MITIAESDWKKFKKLRTIALDRFSQRVLDKSQAICADTSTTAHDRYLKLYGLLQEQDRELARAFDAFSRSTAVHCLVLMVSHNLLTEQELSEFSMEIQNVVPSK